MSGSEQQSDVLSILLFISLSLLLMIICYELKKHLHIPVSPTLLLLGIALRASGPYIGHLSDMVLTVNKVHEDLLSLVFFPILLFEASLSVEWHTIKKEFWQIVPLATTVVIACTALTALALKFVFMYDYTLSNLLLLGLVLSATDHIAVTASLKDIFASDSLETLISGETLLNDATVIVIFKVLIANTEGVNGIKDSLVLFARLSFGGFAIGIAFAAAMSLVIKRILNDFYIETNLALIASYLLFWVCEVTSVHVSGALALVTYGLFMSAYGKTFISPSVEERMHQVLNIFSRNCEAIVFIIAGMLFANTTIYENSELTIKDYYTLLLLFPLTYIIRFFVLFLHYPALKYFGYGINWREMIVLGFSGMKGVISTILALTTYHNDSVDPHLKALINYFAIGSACLSILLGGFAMRRSTRMLGLESLTDVQENMLAGVVKALIENSESLISKLQHQDLNLVDWETVLRTSGPDSLTQSVLKHSKIGKKVLVENYGGDSRDLLHKFTLQFNLRRDALEIEMRRRYLATLRRIYWERFEEGFCHGDTCLILINSCDLCLDHDKEPMKDWKIIRERIYSNKTLSVFAKLSKLPLVGRVFRKMLYKRVILAYDSASNFTKCHEEAEKLIDEMEIDIDKDVFDQIIEEAQVQVSLCEEFMNNFIVDCYPEVLAEVQSKRCCKLLLYKQKELINEIYEDGLIQEVEFLALEKAIDSSIQTVTFQGIPTMPVLRDVLINRFTSANSSEINYLIKQIKEYIFEPGQILFSEGEQVTGAYLIIRGRVNEKSSWINQELIIGNIAGVQHLTEEFSKTYTSTATAITSTVVAHIPKEIIRSEGFVEDLYTEASEELILLNRERYDLISVKEVYILRVISASVIKVLRKGKKAAFTNGALLLKGKVSEKESKWVIKPSQKIRVVSEESIVLMLPKDFMYSYSKDKSLASAFKKFCVKISCANVVSGVIGGIHDLDLKLDDTAILINKQRSKDTRFSLKFKSILPEYHGHD